MISRQNNKLARGEQETVAGVYTYRINDRYCIEYDSEDLSAVMLYQSELQKQNKEKADIMLQSRGLYLPKEETYISYDDSIPYSVDNVKQILNSDKYKNSLSHFLSDLESNCFNQTEKLINNYKQLLYYKKYHNATLDDISKEYITGSQNPYINAIGNELKEQELVRCDDVAATLEP